MPGQLKIETSCDAPNCRYLASWTVHWFPDAVFGADPKAVTRRLCTLHVCATWTVADDELQLQLDYGA